MEVERYFEQLKGKLTELEERDYRNQSRTKLIPPHLVLIPHHNHQQQEKILKRERHQRLKNQGLLAGSVNIVGNGNGNGNDDNDSGETRTNLFEDPSLKQVYLRPWNKLEMEYRISRLLIFIDQYQKQEQLAPDDGKQLRELLLNAVFRRQLGQEHQINYDFQQGRIIEISGLQRDPKTGHFMLVKNQDEPIDPVGYLSHVSKISEQLEEDQQLKIRCQQYQPLISLKLKQDEPGLSAGKTSVGSFLKIKKIKKNSPLRQRGKATTQTLTSTPTPTISVKEKVTVKEKTKAPVTKPKKSAPALKKKQLAKPVKKKAPPTVVTAKNI